MCSQMCPHAASCLKVTEVLALGQPATGEAAAAAAAAAYIESLFTLQKMAPQKPSLSVFTFLNKEKGNIWSMR